MTATSTNPPLSNFGAECVEKGQLLIQLESVFQDIYDPGTNAKGPVNLGIAENTLMHQELADYFEKAFKLRPLDFTYGDGYMGTKRLSSAVAQFLNFSFHPFTPIDRSHLFLAAGVTSVMRQVTRAIANPQDGILIVAPYYPGFDHDFTLAHNLKPVPVSMPLEDVATINEIPHLERAFQENTAAGTPIKAVVLCNPHNPLGRCYPKDVIEAYCHFAEKHNIHLLSDEIYAKSVFPSTDYTSPAPFISILSLDLVTLGINPVRVHALYGMSKDFNANGFRAGVLISQHNPDLMQSLAVTANFTSVASPTDILWSALLTDAPFRDSFLLQNQAKLTEAYEFMTSWLRIHQVPYVPSQAGHFLLVDFRAILSDVSRYGQMAGFGEGDGMAKREEALWQYLLGKGVILMPGAMCHAPEPGWYRLSFAVRRDFVTVGLGRIEEGMGW